MNPDLYVIPDDLLSSISGGDFKTAVVVVGATIWSIFEIPHMISGMREFVNYAGDRYYHGCTHDPNDHFTALICQIVKSDTKTNESSQ